MFTRSQAKIYKQQQQQQAQQQQAQQQQAQQQQQQQAQQQQAQHQQAQQKVKQTSDIIKNHLNVLNHHSCLCTSVRIGKINELYDYMLKDETKQTLLLPRFSSFRVSLLKKTNELMTELLVKLQKEKSVERQTTNLELFDNLNAMTRFLQEQVQKQQQQEQYHQQQQQEHEQQQQQQQHEQQQQQQEHEQQQQQQEHEQQQQQQEQEQQQQQPCPPASARSPRKKVSTQVLLRRSARLMAKYA